MLKMDKMILKINRALDFYHKNGLAEFIRSKFIDRAFQKYHETKIYWSPRRLYVPLSRINIDRPVFLLGLQGGGGTLFSRMIKRNNNVVTITGNNDFWAGSDEMHNYHRFKALPDSWVLRGPGYNNMTGRETDHPIFGLGRGGVYGVDSLVSEYRKTEKDWSPALDSAIKDKIKQCIRANSHDIDKARFIDMSQTYALKIPLLKKCFPDAKFVLMLRNPYAICWRLATKNPERKYMLWNRVPDQYEAVKLAAEHYANNMSIALRDIKKHGGMIIRYEDVIEKPEATLKKVLYFIDLDFSFELLPQPGQKMPWGSKDKKKWYPIKKEINTKYLSEIPDWACVIIKDRCGGIIEEFDYDKELQQVKR
ncbi:hypothetical protein AKJ60_00075 [candidate division MSBL1 archaeon SCGC-AAA385M11]|nr:hypothetical protein AKJ60_00075 [candidate division MSBL1 archaeon SCGC-AAA385M11]